jgi:DtxR family Mn-dependent transcriptional regulator
MLSRKAEDYLEAILNITDDKGYARTKDVAVSLDLRPPSVTEMVQKLDSLGYLVYRRYEGVTLTEKGRKIALVIKDRHQTLKAFLEIINIPREIADKDACTMEHELNDITTKQIKNFVKFVETAPDSSQWLERFERFCLTRN